jgi:hypothetical protein
MIAELTAQIAKFKLDLQSATDKNTVVVTSSPTLFRTMREGEIVADKDIRSDLARPLLKLVICDPHLTRLHLTDLTLASHSLNGKVSDADITRVLRFLELGICSALEYVTSQIPVFH